MFQFYAIAIAIIQPTTASAKEEEVVLSNWLQFVENPFNLTETKGLIRRLFSL